MSWNFIVRSKDEAAQAIADWASHGPRFGRVATHLARIPAPMDS